MIELILPQRAAELLFFLAYISIVELLSGLLEGTLLALVGGDLRVLLMHLLLLLRLQLLLWGHAGRDALPKVRRAVEVRRASSAKQTLLMLFGELALVISLLGLLLLVLHLLVPLLIGMYGVLHLLWDWTSCCLHLFSLLHHHIVLLLLLLHHHLTLSSVYAVADLMCGWAWITVHHGIRCHIWGCSVRHASRS